MYVRLEMVGLVGLTRHDTSTPNGIRTRVAAVKGRSPRPLDDGSEAPILSYYPYRNMPTAKTAWFAPISNRLSNNPLGDAAWAAASSGVAGAS